MKCATHVNATDPEGRELDDPPDAVTFSKKMQIAGYYTKPDLVPDLPYRVFNTWMGDPSKVLMLEAVLDCVEKDGLVENAVGGARDARRPHLLTPWLCKGDRGFKTV